MSNSSGVAPASSSASPPASPLASPSASPSASPLEERAANQLPYAAFVAEFMRRNRPVIIRGAVRDWPALSRWTPDYFATRFKDRNVQVGYSTEMNFAEFVKRVQASSESRPGPYMYRCFLHEHLPDVLADLVPQGEYAFPRRYASVLMPGYWRRPDGHLKLLMGGAGGRFPVLHYDTENVHATVTEIYGDKEFVMFAPADGRYLYPDPEQPNQSLISDLANVDHARYPGFTEAKPLRGVVGPGDMMFIPCGWWHSARALNVSISVGMNILDASNWAGFVDEVTRVQSRVTRPVLRAYLLAMGKLLDVLERMRFSSLPLISRIAPTSARDVKDPSLHPLVVAQPTR